MPEIQWKKTVQEDFIDYRSYSNVNISGGGCTGDCPTANASNNSADWTSDLSCPTLCTGEGGGGYIPVGIPPTCTTLGGTGCDKDYLYPFCVRICNGDDFQVCNNTCVAHCNIVKSTSPSTYDCFHNCGHLFTCSAVQNPGYYNGDYGTGPLEGSVYCSWLPYYICVSYGQQWYRNQAALQAAIDAYNTFKGCDHVFNDVTPYCEDNYASVAMYAGEYCRDTYEDLKDILSCSGDGSPFGSYGTECRIFRNHDCCPPSPCGEIVFLGLVGSETEADPSCCNYCNVNYEENRRDECAGISCAFNWSNVCNNASNCTSVCEGVCGQLCLWVAAQPPTYTCANACGNNCPNNCPLHYHTNVSTASKCTSAGLGAVVCGLNCTIISNCTYDHNQYVPPQCVEDYLNYYTANLYGYDILRAPQHCDWDTTVCGEHIRDKNSRYPNDGARCALVYAVDYGAFNPSLPPESRVMSGRGKSKGGAGCGRLCTSVCSIAESWYITEQEIDSGNLYDGEDWRPMRTDISWKDYCNSYVTGKGLVTYESENFPLTEWRQCVQHFDNVTCGINR